MNLGQHAKSGNYVLNKNAPYTVPKEGSFFISYWRWDGLGSSTWEEVTDYVNLAPYTSHTILEPNHYVDQVRIMTGLGPMLSQTTLPGVGVTSISDHNGKNTRFNYNAFGMLESIQSDDRQIVEKYAYTYSPSNIINHSQPVKIERYNGISFNTTMRYFDGLGRLAQNIDVDASAKNGRDFVSLATYDNMGRESERRLPFAISLSGNNGAEILNATTAHLSFYTSLIRNDDGYYAFSKKHYDDSPLNLVLKASLPGKSNNANHVTEGKPLQHQYRLNSTDEIKEFRVNSNGQLVYKGYYPANLLQVNRIHKDGSNDDDRDSYEYINALGQLIAKENRISPIDRRITYYVYDDFGRQRYVIPSIVEINITLPDAAFSSSHEDIVKYCYYTEYDFRGYPIREHTPGTGITSHVYDLFGRLILSQDAQMAQNNQWAFTKYDSQSRPVLSGVTTISGTAESLFTAMQSYMAADMLLRSYEGRGYHLHGYTNFSHPTSINANEVLSVTYYDDYEWTNGYAFSFADTLSGVTKTVNRVTGLVTGAKTKVLGTGVPNQWLTTAIYYDDHNNPIQTVADLYPSGIEIVSNKHNFMGQVTKTKVKQTIGVTVNEYNKWYEYDNFGRLLNIRKKITGDPQGEILLAKYEYDDLGNITLKRVHDENESTVYTYDIAGRVLSATSLDFSYKIGYDESLLPGIPARTDRLISQVTWSNSNTGSQMGYAYTYDKLSQLTDARLSEKSGSTWQPATNKFRERFAYDRNGNITTLQRYNSFAQPMHNYSYTYNEPANGNAVSWIGCSGAYTYDVNGNMTTDGMNNSQIEYNILNLPRRIFGASDEINYIYAANGQKTRHKLGKNEKNNLCNCSLIRFIGFLR